MNTESSHTREELREQLADLQHQQWSGWMQYLLGKCSLANSKEGDGFDRIIPYKYSQNLIRLLETEYKNLTEKEKES